jgi:hypothetical protein
VKLLSLNDPRWQTYRGGYNRVPFDCIPLIRRLETEGTSEAFWEIVWDELHHQGDVGEATYAIVPYLARHLLNADSIDAMIFGFVAVVELERHSHGNPPIPPELQGGYDWGIQQLLMGTVAKPIRNWDEDLLRNYVALLAAIKGHRTLCNAYQEMGEPEARKFLAEYYDDPSWMTNR